jgi:hypothetical protein
MPSIVTPPRDNIIMLMPFEQIVNCAVCTNCAHLFQRAYVNVHFSACIASSCSSPYYCPLLVKAGSETDSLCLRRA